MCDWLKWRTEGKCWADQLVSADIRLLENNLERKSAECQNHRDEKHTHAPAEQPDPARKDLDRPCHLIPGELNAGLHRIISGLISVSVMRKRKNSADHDSAFTSSLLDARSDLKHCNKTTDAGSEAEGSGKAMGRRYKRWDWLHNQYYTDSCCQNNFIDVEAYNWIHCYMFSLSRDLSKLSLSYITVIISTSCIPRCDIIILHFFDNNSK